MYMPLKKQQQGATFLSWVATICLVIFVAVTIVKLAPIYLEYSAVKTMVKDAAQDGSIRDTQQLRRKLASALNVNGLSNVQEKNFSLVNLPEQQNAPAVEVDYEVRKKWIANIDFLVTFKYAEALKRQ